MRVILLLALGVLLHAGSAVVCQDGPPVSISEVDIIGNTSFTKRELLAVIEARASSWFSWMPGVDPRPLVSSGIRTDVLRLESFYRDEGFLSVSVDTVVEAQKKGMRVAFLVTEGDPVLVDSVVVEGMSEKFLSGKQIKTIPGERLTRSHVEEDRLFILSALRDSGYVFSAVSVSTGLIPGRNRAVVHIEAEPGYRYRFGDVIVRGNQNVGVRTIKRGLTFRPGASYKQKRVRDARLQLYRSGAFRSVLLAFPDSLTRDSLVSTVVTVSERALRSAKLGGGYDTQNKVNGSVSWTHRSAFGGAQKFRLAVDASAVRVEGRVNITQPYVFGSRNWMDFSMFVREEQKEGFRQTELGGTVTFERNIATRTTLSFEVGPRLVDFNSDSLFAQFATRFTNDRRDDFLDPGQGVFVQLFARERGALLRSDLELLEFSADVRWYRPFLMHSVLAARVSGAIIANLSDGGQVPGIERLFAGGLSSVRGWGFNQLGPKDERGEAAGGKSKVEASVELRFKLGKYLGAALFLDTGNVHESFEAFDLAQLKWAVGGGVRYLSPVGPVRLDAGRRLSFDRTDLWQYHFSIGQAF